MGAILYSVGHGNRTLEELLVLLRETKIHTLADVRAQPQSSRHPWFSAAALFDSP